MKKAISTSIHILYTFLPQLLLPLFFPFILILLFFFAGDDGWFSWVGPFVMGLICLGIPLLLLVCSSILLYSKHVPKLIERFHLFTIITMIVLLGLSFGSGYLEWSFLFPLSSSSLFYVKGYYVFVLIASLIVAGVITLIQKFKKV